jgi:allantoinase
VPGSIPAPSKPSSPPSASPSIWQAKPAATSTSSTSPARKQGVQVTVETCPHYLLLDDAAAIAIGPAAKCAPPIRSAATVGALWQKLLSGEIDTLGSDHSPSPLDLKQGTDLFAMWGGIAGIQHALPLLLSRNQSIIPQLSSNVATRFRLPNKGSLTPGHDADFFLLEKKPNTIAASQLLTRHPITPYLGLTSTHSITATYLRGQKVTSETRGKFLTNLSEIEELHS